VLVGGRSFHDREEVIALRNALTAIEWPDDELKVFATLRGPFFALSDEALLAFRQRPDAPRCTGRRLGLESVCHATG
jgi:ATP-dependent exoDNAse (exonuclease V) beta subunit